MSPGRPSLYTQELADEICERLSVGEPLAQICRDDHMPAVRTVYDWQKAHSDFSTSIARAREEGFDHIAVDCLHIADDNRKDTRLLGGEGEDAYEAPDHDWISRSKLRIETRLKLLAKWDPKRYGDKQEVTHELGEGFADLMQKAKRGE
jgi:hypothetical protein